MTATDTIARLNSSLTGRYTIERELGAGGMATVYLAADLKHDRHVALKVLKPELAAVLGAERFVVEIKTTAALQHPHILPLFDSGTADSFLFYVMPFIEGETLREKLNRETQLGVDEAVRIAREVLDALQYAHEHGIVHRDVKPENILLHGGHAMVADFGIALAVSAAAGGRMTETGLSLGTPFYMSPEQATAEKEITARSDVYSLGSVLYEMLTGNPPHTGSSAQQIIMRIITDPARPVGEVRKSVPPNVAAAVAKSLEKLPADRFVSARAFAEALDNPGYANAAASGTARGSSAGDAASFKRRFIGASVLATLLLVAAAWEWRDANREETRTTVRFALALPHNVSVSSNTSAPVQISPDGRLVAFAGAGKDGNLRLFIRSLDDLAIRPLPGTENASQPFFSPDSRWIGFYRQGKLFKVPVDGSSVLALADLPAGTFSGASWSSSGVIVASVGGILVTLPATGGASQPLTKVDTAHGESSQRWPHVLDDGATVLYASRAGAGGNGRIGIASLKTGRTSILDVLGAAPLGIVDGLLVYGNQSGGLMAVPFDARRGRLTGAPAPVVTDVVVVIGGATGASMSTDGSLVYLNGSSSSQVVLTDAHGSARPLITEEKSYRYPRFSPDGRRLAISIEAGGQSDVWIYDVATHTNMKLTTEGAPGERPEWSPDGKRVMFQSTRNGKRTLWWRPADLSAPAEQLFKGDTTGILEGVFTPDGRTVVYKSGGQDIYFRRLEGDTAPKPIATTPANETEPRVSPDGRWVAYASNESGGFQIFVQPFPGPGGKTQISTGGGTEPVWSRDGHRLVYRQADRLIAVTFTAKPAFNVTSQATLFEGVYETGAAAHASYDISPDGTQFLLLKTAEDPQTVVAHDWRYELRAHMRQQTTAASRTPR